MHPAQAPERETPERKTTGRAAAGRPPSADAGRDAHLAFLVGGERVALPLSRVDKVLRPPEIVGLPLSPAGVLGLANLRGEVTAVAALHEALGLAPARVAEASRLVVVRHDTPVALLVDRLLGVTPIPAERIRPAAEEGAGEGTEAGARGPAAGDLLAGVARGAEGDGGTLVLDLDRALARVFRTPARPAPRPPGAAHRPAAAAQRTGEGAEARGRALLSFEAAGEEYAVPVASVREIVGLPSAVSRVPHARGHVLGVATLRGRLVPLLSARALLGLPPPGGEADGRAKVLLLSVEVEAGAQGATVGLVVDRPREILRVREDAIEPVPALLARDVAGDIEGICRLEGGRRIVSVVSPAHLLRSDAAIRALAAGGNREGAMAGTQAPGTAGTGEGEGETEQFVGFRLGAVEYGLPVSAVEEVIRVPEVVTPVPKAPPYVAGIVNRRGAAMPLVDQRRRFDMPPAEGAARHVVVIALGAARVGFLVDAVTSVLRVPAAAIGPAPGLSAEQARLISRVANLGGRMVLLLSPEHMVSPEEAETLAEVAAEAGPGAPADPAADQAPNQTPNQG
jgi:purine-binding chemotaxis protein CheW